MRPRMRRGLGQTDERRWVDERKGRGDEGEDRERDAEDPGDSLSLPV